MERKKIKMQKFQISGKVTTENKEEISGLKAQAFVAGTKKVLGSATIDKEGKYSIDFEYAKPVDVEISVSLDARKEMLERLPTAKFSVSKDLIAKKNNLIGADIKVTSTLYKIWSTVCKQYTVFGLVLKGVPDPANPGTYLSLIPIPNAKVHIYDVSKPWIIWPGHTFPYSENEIGTAMTDNNGLFIFDFNWCYKQLFLNPQYPVWLFPPDYKPDIIFKVTQSVNNINVPIYAEDPSKTRWNIEQLPPLGVTLIVEGNVVLPDDPINPIVGDFEFHGIGKVLISQITDGYASTPGIGDIGARDSPFGSALDVKGQFNQALHGKNYQVLYAKWSDDTTPPATADFVPILDESWQIARYTAGDWVTIYKNPIVLPIAGGGCYKVPDYTDLFETSKDILIRWTTNRNDLGAPRYPNGKYSLMVKAFEDDGTLIPLNPGNPVVLLTVVVDNSWPTAKMQETIGIVSGLTPLCPNPKPLGLICDNPTACGIVYIESGKKLQVKFDAYDAESHFRNYSLTYRTGHGKEVAIPNGSKDYKGPPRNDYGFTNEIVDWEIGGLTQCGYEVRVRVWDRTVNGYKLIHEVEDFIHIILLEIP